MYKIIYFNYTMHGNVTVFERVLNMPYERVWQIAHTSVYQYANRFRIEEVKRFRYRFSFPDGVTCVTVGSSVEDAESHFTGPCKLVSIDRLQNILSI